MKPYLVNVPVRVTIWIRPESQREQFEILRQARPSIIFLQSDGGRNDEEWAAINKNRKMFEEEIDWECRVYKLYENENLGLYAMAQKTAECIWKTVDRCIFLEDDYVMSVSFFRFCAELLEKYKDDQRIQMICGCNILEQYKDAEPYDYFFTERGWSIWGIATWRRSQENREYPLDYRNNVYVKRCLKDNLSDFWYKKVEGYCDNPVFEGHAPASEFYYGVNTVLYHRVCIMPTYNMISNTGIQGNDFDYADVDRRLIPSYFNMKTYEVGETIRHPKYVIDDKHYSELYSEMLGHTKHGIMRNGFNKILHYFKVIIYGDGIKAFKRKLNKIRK